MKTTISEMKNTLDGINDRLNTAKEKMNELKGKPTDLSKMKYTYKKMQKLNSTLSCRVNFKLPNTWITRVLKLRLGRGQEKYLKK